MLTTNQAITDFLNHCRYEKNLSAKTLKFYTIDLSQMATFMQQSNYSPHIAELDKIAIKAYLKELHHWKPKTIKRKIATMKALFNYLEFEDVILVNPLRKIRIKIKEPVILPKALTKGETRTLLQTAYNAITAAKTTTDAYRNTIRNAAIIELLFATGARVSEIVNLQVSDVNFTSGKINVKGKGNRERIVYICDEQALNTLRKYYQFFHKEIEHNDNYLWVNRLHKRLTDQSFRIIVRNLTQHAALDKRVTPHVFRHTFATLLLENDVDIKYIQSLLGHSSIITTQIYTQVNREKQKQLLEDKHPRKGMIMKTAGI